ASPVRNAPHDRRQPPQIRRASDEGWSFQDVPKIPSSCRRKFHTNAERRGLCGNYRMLREISPPSLHDRLRLLTESSDRAAPYLGSETLACTYQPDGGSNCYRGRL